MFSRTLRSSTNLPRHRQRSVSLLPSSHRLLKTPNHAARRALLVSRTQVADSQGSIIKPAVGFTPKTAPGRIFLPPFLQVPRLPAINHQRVALADPTLAKLPLGYVVEKLSLPQIGVKMLTAVSQVKIQTSPTTLPLSYEVPLNDAIRAAPPTHLLACWSKPAAGKPSGPRRITLIPTHELVHAAHCATMPAFPPAIDSVLTDDSTAITLPVVPLCLPSAETFPLLQTYLYSKRADSLLAALLPAGALSLISHDGDQSKLASRLAASAEFAVLGKCAVTVNGLWRNACALSVHDQRLWDVIRMAWTALVAAMHISSADSDREKMIKQEAI